MLTNKQFERLLFMRHKKKYHYQLADAVGISGTTARKYLKENRLPSQLKKPHDWNTREDVFADVWPEAVGFLENNTGVEAKALFEYIRNQNKGRFKSNQLRTFQRKVKHWKALYGPGLEVYFPQDYKPGQFAASDFTKMNNIGITINWIPFEHSLFHFVLCYSNHESATIIKGGESFENLSLGVQNALWEIGKVPAFHRTDNLSAAVSKVGYPKEYTDNYKALTNHYKIEPISIQPGKPNENGDVEQSHYRLITAIEQALIFRGNKNFDSVEEYNDFVQKIVKQRNQQRNDKLLEELKAMRKLPAKRYDDYNKFDCKVGSSSTINVQKKIYSVHSRLIGEKVKAKIFPDYLEIWYGQKLIEKLERLKGSKTHSINYRHIIDYLVRKPGAFENYRYKDDMFPSSIFRVAYDILTEISHSRKLANKQYLKILELAAKENESLVRSSLKTLIDNNNHVSFEVIEAMVKSQTQPDAITDVYIADIDLGFYDGLLEEVLS
jgi:hypothetical protein